MSEKIKVKYKALDQVKPASNQNDSDDNTSVASAVSAASVAAGVQCALAKAKLPKLDFPIFLPWSNKRA